MENQISSAARTAVQGSVPFEKANTRSTAPSVRTPIRCSQILTNEISSDIVCEVTYCSVEKRDNSHFCANRKASKSKAIPCISLLTVQTLVLCGTVLKVVGWTSIVPIVGVASY
jgi:hypothetical protein